MIPEQIEVRRRWIAALRSGKYKQGRRGLRIIYGDNELWCCLGVLCDVVAPENWVSSGQFYQAYQHLEGFSALPTTAILESAGIDQFELNRLIQMNDGLGRTFEQIADFLERRLDDEASAQDGV